MINKLKMGSHNLSLTLITVIKHHSVCCYRKVSLKCQSRIRGCHCCCQLHKSCCFTNLFISRHKPDSKQPLCYNYYHLIFMANMLGNCLTSARGTLPIPPGSSFSSAVKRKAAPSFFLHGLIILPKCQYIMMGKTV